MAKGAPLAGIVIVALALVGCGGNRWDDESVRLGPGPNAAAGAAFLQEVRADVSPRSIDASAVSDADLVDGGRFFCAAMTIVQREDHHAPNQDDLEEVISEIADRYNYGRAKVAADNDHPGLTDDDASVVTASSVSRYGLTAFCPNQKLDLLR
jgi:hypothetical protein